MSRFSRLIATNTLVQVFGRVAATAVSLITVSYLNGLLHPTGWGYYVAVTTYVGFFAVLADMGLNMYFLRELSKNVEDEEDLTARFIGFRLVTALLMMALAPALSFALPAYRTQSLGIAIVSFAQFFLVINQIFVTLFQVRVTMWKAVMSDLVGRLIILIAVLSIPLLVPAESYLSAAFFVLIIGNLINMAVSYAVAARMVTIRVRFAWKEWPSLFLAVFPMGSLAVLGLIHFKADSVILTLYRPITEVGVYGNAYKIMEVLITLPAMFVGSLIPAFTQSLLHDSDRLGNLIQKSFDVLMVVVVPVVTVTVFLAPNLVALLTRNYVQDSSDALKILAFALPPLFIRTLASTLLIIANQQKKLCLIELLLIGINIVLNIALIPLYGFRGAAYITVITEVLTILFVGVFAVRQFNIRLKWKKVFMALMGSAVMIGGFLLINRLVVNPVGDLSASSRFDQSLGLLWKILIATLLYFIPFIGYNLLLTGKLRWKGLFN